MLHAAEKSRIATAAAAEANIWKQCFDRVIVMRSSEKDDCVRTQNSDLMRQGSEIQQLFGEEWVRQNLLLVANIEIRPNERTRGYTWLQ